MINLKQINKTTNKQSKQTNPTFIAVVVVLTHAEVAVEHGELVLLGADGVVVEKATRADPLAHPRADFDPVGAPHP